MLLFSLVGFLNCLTPLEKHLFVINNRNNDFLITDDGKPTKTVSKDLGGVTLAVYSIFDYSRPFALVSHDNKKVLVVGEGDEVVAKDTKLFIDYNLYGTQCAYSINKKDPMCEALSHAMDPTETEKDKEDDKDTGDKGKEDKDKEDKDKEDNKEKDTGDEDEEDEKDKAKEKEAKEINKISFDDYFVWTTGIADGEGNQQIYNTKNGKCLALIEGKLKMDICQKRQIDERWKFNEVIDSPKEALEEIKRSIDFSEKLEENMNKDDEEKDKAKTKRRGKSKKKKQQRNFNPRFVPVTQQPTFIPLGGVQQTPMPYAFPMGYPQGKEYPSQRDEGNPPTNPQINPQQQFPPLLNSFFPVWNQNGQAFSPFVGPNGQFMNGVQFLGAPDMNSPMNNPVMNPMNSPMNPPVQNPKDKENDKEGDKEEPNKEDDKENKPNQQPPIQPYPQPYPLPSPFFNPLGAYPSISPGPSTLIVNTTAKDTGKDKKDEGKSNPIGNLVGGMAKRSPLGALLGA